MFSISNMLPVWFKFWNIFEFLFQFQFLIYVSVSVSLTEITLYVALFRNDDNFKAIAVANRGQISDFLTSVKIMEGIDKMS